MCSMIADVQLWDVRLLTLNEFPIQEFNLARLKPFFSYICNPNKQKPLDRPYIHIFKPVISSAVVMNFARPSFILILQVSVSKS